MTDVDVRQVPVPAGVFERQGDHWIPTILSRGPWDERAQHGGAPGALLAHEAEATQDDPGWGLSRLTVELIKPVPVAPLRVRKEVHPGRSTSRVTLDLVAGDQLVARGHALLMRRDPLDLPDGISGWSPERMLPAPEDCTSALLIPGMPQGTSFHATAVEARIAQGDAAAPGPAAAWFRLAVPLVDGTPNSPAMSALAAADFGNGLSWLLRPDQYLFTNPDLTVNLVRPARGEWIGVMAETQADSGGTALTRSRLYDEHGPIGIASQTLLLRKRSDQP